MIIIDIIEKSNVAWGVDFREYLFWCCLLHLFIEVDH